MEDSWISYLLLHLICSNVTCPVTLENSTIHSRENVRKKANDVPVFVAVFLVAAVANQHKLDDMRQQGFILLHPRGRKSKFQVSAGHVSSRDSGADLIFASSSFWRLSTFLGLLFCYFHCQLYITSSTVSTLYRQLSLDLGSPIKSRETLSILEP